MKNVSVSVVLELLPLRGHAHKTISCYFRNKLPFVQLPMELLNEHCNELTELNTELSGNEHGCSRERLINKNKITSYAQCLQL